MSPDDPTGGQTHRQTSKQAADDDQDDELGDLPSTWMRTMTMPPVLSEVAPRLPPGAWEQVSTTRAKANSGSWAALMESEELDDVDDADVNNNEDMWCRMRTMPASMPAPMQASMPALASFREDWKLHPLSNLEPSRRWSRETSSTLSCRSIDTLQGSASALPSEAVARWQADSVLGLKDLQARQTSELSKGWSRQTSDTTCWTTDTHDTYVSSSANPQKACSSPSMSQDSCSLATSPEGARGPVDERSMQPGVMPTVMTVVPVMLVQGLHGPGPSASALLRKQLEESARLLNAAAPDHYED
jgi:hypothetical protein